MKNFGIERKYVKFSQDKSFHEIPMYLSCFLKTRYLKNISILLDQKTLLSVSFKIRGRIYQTPGRAFEALMENQRLSQPRV